MPPNRPNLSKIASTAMPGENGKMHAPSALRNRDAITTAIKPFMPGSGTALEIASGTGEHVIRYAKEFPDIIWQPSDIENDRLESIAAWSSEIGLINILAPVFLDAAQAGWPQTHANLDVIILSNLLHLIRDAEALTIISEASRALAPNGVFLIYGPFRRGDNFASASDKNFHERLRNTSAEIGYKSFQFIQTAVTRAGLTNIDAVEMPSNNLLLVARKIRL